MKRRISDEIAEALRRDIECGRWKAGERLPSVDELRKRFSAGEYAVRTALKKLRGEGAILLRQNLGAVASGKFVRKWKGRVLFIDESALGSYFTCMVERCLARRFALAGWDFAAVSVAAGQVGGLDTLMAYLERGVTFAVGIFASRQTVDAVDAAGVPYVALSFNLDDKFPSAVAVLIPDARDAYAKMIDAMTGRGVKYVVEFDHERKMNREFKAMMVKAGLDVRRVLCQWKGGGPQSLADVKWCGYRAVAQFFGSERNRRNLPDAILFDDDYLAFGGMTAIFEAGFCIPVDVKVVSYSNRGDEPIAGIPLARIENDPVAYADKVADYVLCVLGGGCAEPPKIPLRFVPGESL